VEKCGKVWRPAAAGRPGSVDGACDISGVGGGHEVRACSACAGDYEDPERRTWTPDDQEDEECDDMTRREVEEFPAEE